MRIDTEYSLSRGTLERHEPDSASYLHIVRIPAKVNADSEGNVNVIPGRRRTVFGA